MFEFFTWMANWLGNLLPWFMSLIRAMFQPVWDLAVDLVCFVFEKVLAAVVLMVSAIPVPAWDLNSYMAGAPTEVLGMMTAIRIPEALGIIVVALGIRFALQLIPFVRLGS